MSRGWIETDEKHGDEEPFVKIGGKPAAEVIGDEEAHDVFVDVEDHDPFGGGFVPDDFGVAVAAFDVQQFFYIRNQQE